jgi:hypothetical protein
LFSDIIDLLFSSEKKYYFIHWSVPLSKKKVAGFPLQSFLKQEKDLRGIYPEPVEGIPNATPLLKT